MSRNNYKGFKGSQEGKEDQEDLDLVSDSEMGKEMEVSQKQPEKQIKQEKVSFTAWFAMKVEQDRRIKPNHLSAIKQFFFKDIGLTENELQNKFEDALDKFGYKRRG